MWPIWLGVARPGFSSPDGDSSSWAVLTRLRNEAAAPGDDYLSAEQEANRNAIPEQFYPLNHGTAGEPT